MILALVLAVANLFKHVPNVRQSGVSPVFVNEGSPKTSPKKIDNPNLKTFRVLEILYSVF